jgi:hypothetical protein
MPFQKGRAKTGGKKPFTKNKITRDVARLLDSLNCNPIEGMARIACDEKVPVQIRAKMYAELSQYVSPKLRSVEHSGPGGGPIEVDATVSPLELLERGIARINDRKRAPGDLGKPDGTSAT